MISKAILPFLIFLITHHPLPITTDHRSPITDHQIPQSGISIENKINRGVNWTDPEGRDWSIRYIPVTVSNDSSVLINIEINFSKEYYYPNPDDDKKFKLIPLPEAWALDGVGVSEEMLKGLPALIDNPVLKKDIEPGGKLVFAIGSLYPRPAEASGVLPRTLFVQGEADEFADCDWQMEKRSSSNQLGLRIIFGDKCRVIEVGQITY